ncbi:MAG: urease accessory protein UreD [Pseudomonadota bacterium]
MATPEPAQSARPHQPRAEGHVTVTARATGGASRLDRLRQSGSAKALFPKGAGDEVQAVLLNTAGGVTGGDRFSYRGTAASGAALTLTTQAAERAYRAKPGETGQVEARLDAGAGARIDWLPQETILFDGARVTRRLEVDLAEDATLLAVEPLIFGRIAMGEALQQLTFTDHWRVRRSGRLIYADALRLVGEGEALIARPFTFAGARAMASILYTGPEAEARLAPLRATLSATAGASLIRPGVLVARVLAEDGFQLRRSLIPALRCLRGGALPKVWTL